MENEVQEPPKVEIVGPANDDFFQVNMIMIKVRDSIALMMLVHPEKKLCKVAFDGVNRRKFGNEREISELQEFPTDVFTYGEIRKWNPGIELPEESPS